MAEASAILAEYGAGNVHAFPSYVIAGAVSVFANSDGPNADSVLSFFAQTSDVRAFALDLLRVADAADAAAETSDSV